jgi:undecaprenyl diphosphate synthase
LKAVSGLPHHVAIIMDGNGRWAELRRRDRTFGHLKGARVAKEVIEICAHMGLPQLTLYAFSTENWLRPKMEVAFLMVLLGRHLKRERASLVKNNIRFSVIGEVDRLPAAVLEEVHKTIAATKNNTGMSLTFALSYGGRQEITNAVKQIAEEVASGVLNPAQVTESLISEKLQSAAVHECDPDLIIRTSGEYRLSNFMLWQAAYSELYVTPTLWPDFSTTELNLALKQFSSRERRFGKTKAQVVSPLAVSTERSAPLQAQVSFS